MKRCLVSGAGENLWLLRLIDCLDVHSQIWSQYFINTLQKILVTSQQNKNSCFFQTFLSQFTEINHLGNTSYKFEARNQKWGI